MEDKRIQLMRDEKVSIAIRKMSVPAVVGLLVLAVYNLVDTMFVAWLGTEATGATQVVMPIMMLMSSFGLAIGMGSGSYISRLLGESNKRRADEVGSVAMITSLISGVSFTLLLLVFIEPMLGFFGASQDIMAMSKSYGIYIILGSVFTMSNMTMNNMLRAEGSAKLSMIGMAAGALLNIILDPIFIFVFDLGIAGAAMATSLSQLVTFTILISRYLSGHSVVHISIKYFKPTIEIYSEIMKVGVPTFLRQVLFSISIGILNNGAVDQGGEALLAAIGLIFKITMVPMYVIFGIGQGFQPVVGYNFGAKNKKRVIQALQYSIKISMFVSVIASILLIVFSEQILTIFRVSDSVMAYGIKGLTLYSVSILFVGLSNTIGVFYQALGKGRESLLLAIARQGIFFIPALVILPSLFGVTGILAAQLVADVLALGLTGVMFIPFLINHKLDKAMGLQRDDLIAEGE